ncbi:MAG: neuraminidase (sialidase)-like protein [bacterium]|nr:neuraminidase (sialidase)-like protein [bacterium]
MCTTLLLVAAIAAAVPAGEADPIHEGNPIFTPNPQHNHGSSIVQTPSGDLIACWFHGSGERKSDDVLVQGARKRAGASEWSEPFVMADSQNLPDCNPVLFVDPRGTLWLFWIAVQSNEWGSSLLKFRTSTQYDADGPPVWEWQDTIHARPKDLEDQFLAFIDETAQKYAAIIEANPEYQEGLKQMKAAANDKLQRRLGWMTRLHPIMLPDNRMMLGLYSDVFNCSLAAFTDDWGATWSFSEPILELGNIQPSFVRRQGGEIAVYMRDNGLPKRIRTATSADGGMTWSKVTPMDIPNPGSSVECIALANGHWVLVCNDTVKGRHLISAYVSEDEGATWGWRRPLESLVDELGKGVGSASYPSVIQDRDGFIHCTYSFKDKSIEGSTIKHVRFNEAWIRAGEALAE